MATTTIPNLIRPLQVNHMNDYSSTPPEFRSRYSADETSDATHEKDLQHLRFQHRKRRAVRFLLLIIGVLSSGVILRIRDLGDMGNQNFQERFKKKGSSSNEAFNSAKRDSFGYFNEIAADEWMGLKHETMEIRNKQDALMAESLHLLSESGANIDPNSWWINNWNVSVPIVHQIFIAN